MERERRSRGESNSGKEKARMAKWGWGSGLLSSTSPSRRWCWLLTADVAMSLFLVIIDFMLLDRVVRGRGGGERNGVATGRVKGWRVEVDWWRSCSWKTQEERGRRKGDGGGVFGLFMREDKVMWWRLAVAAEDTSGGRFRGEGRKQRRRRKEENGRGERKKKWMRLTEFKKNRH